MKCRYNHMRLYRYLIIEFCLFISILNFKHIRHPYEGNCKYTYVCIPSRNLEPQDGIEPSLRLYQRRMLPLSLQRQIKNHFPIVIFSAKAKFNIIKKLLHKNLEPVVGIEPTTSSLQNCCSTD